MRRNVSGLCDSKAVICFILLLSCQPLLFAQRTAVPEKITPDSLVTAAVTDEEPKPAGSAEVPQDSIPAGNYDYSSVRGFERNEKIPANTPRKIFNTIMFIPRVIISSVITAAAYGAALLDENQIVSKFEDIFYLYDHKLGWFPLISIASGFPKGLGLNLFYKEDYLNIDLKGGYSDDEIWGLKGRVSYIFFKPRSIWQLNVSALLQSDDRSRFYGIGADPFNDPRSPFLAAAPGEYGVYQQERLKYEMSLGIRTSPNWEFFYTTFYQKRDVTTPSDESPESIDKVFDTERLAGLNEKNQKWYNEFAVRIDTRENLMRITPGLRAETYLGLALGVGDDKSRLFRAGSDISGFYPLISNNRILVPRLVFDIVENLNKNVEIAFTEYPRHPEFRGVSRRVLLRSDRYKLFTSLEYQWPLTYHLAGHLFYDYLMVAKSPARFTMSNAPWAVGFAIDIHLKLEELARFSIAYGSEGWFLKLNVGFSSFYKDRSDWQ